MSVFNELKASLDEAVEMHQGKIRRRALHATTSLM